MLAPSTLATKAEKLFPHSFGGVALRPYRMYCIELPIKFL